MIKRNSILKSIFIFLIFCASTLSLFAKDFYWANSEVITKKDSRFPSSVSNGAITAVFWQEIDSVNKKIWLSGQIYNANNSNWKTIERFAGPFSYSGEIPDIYSVAIQKSGKIAISVLSDVKTISVYVCENGESNFSKVVLPPQNNPLVAPRIYATSNDSFMLFTSLGQNESFSILCSKSIDAINWQNFEQFAPTVNYMNPFIPVLISTGSSDLVVFQAQYNTGTRLSYQLYSTFSLDDGISWTNPQLITDQNSIPSDSKNYFYNYNNQRPSLCVFDNKVFLSWERTYYTSESSHIWTESISFDGKFLGDLQEITSSGNANRPILFKYDGNLNLVWFDTRTGSESVYFSQKQGLLWDESVLSHKHESEFFIFPVVTDFNKVLSFIWQRNPTKGKISSIVKLSPDKFVEKANLRGIGFKDGERGKTSDKQINISLPEDSSGIAGYSWIWTQNKYEDVPEHLMCLPSQKTVNVDATSDETWYFKVKVLDYAGNWSETSEITYFRDTTPPRKPQVLPFDVDSMGFVSTNDFNFEWKPNSLDDDVVGYTWSFNLLEKVPRKFSFYKNHPLLSTEEETSLYLSSAIEKYSENLKTPNLPKKLLGKNTKVSYKNYINGIYSLSVAAVDSVGNIGETSTVLVATNKYIPFTTITSAKYNSNLFGNNSLSIYGKGFLYDGKIKEIYIDKDGKAPYDYSFYASKNDFTVDSDEVIKNLVIGSDVREGKYCIGLLHSDRGLYFSKSLFTVEQNGTVKIESDYVFDDIWIPFSKKVLLNVELGTVLLWIICLLSIIGGFIAVKGIIQTTRESLAVRKEIRALLKGDVIMAAEKKRTGSLRIKLMVFTILLVLAIVTLVSVALGKRMIATQRQTLAEGLENRVSVLLNSMSTGARSYLPSQSMLELSYLPAQANALSEAKYATITSFSSDATNETLSQVSTSNNTLGSETQNLSDSANSKINYPLIDYVWATNDENISSKIDTDTILYGRSKLLEENIEGILESCINLNEVAEKRIGNIANQIADLTKEGIDLALKTDSRSIARREEIALITTQLNTRVIQILNEISDTGVSSYPSFSNTQLKTDNTEYLFYKPVLYRQGSEKNYVRGIVFLKVSTENLIKSINSARYAIIYSSLFIALGAMVFGAVGSFILATIIVKPIKALEKHVSIIGTTRDKSKLANKKLEFKSNDEIGNLRDALNFMTSELIKASLEEKLSLDGRAVQQAFLPLDTSPEGFKSTTAVLKDKNIEAFGYYEGASGVSGDYFDYKKLDDKWYVFIKCDASGHGVSAGLIMTVVATFFRKYFSEWSFKKNGTRLNELLSQINDFIESLGLKGKFITIILALVNTQTGETYLSNAGDNILRIYDSEQGKIKTIALAETPAAGPISSFIIDMKGGFKVEKLLLKKNDIMLLYTDGIEESTRLCRNQDFSIMQKTEKDASGNSKIINVNELLESERIVQIVESVMSRSSFTLTKDHNPIPSENIVFDFSQCTGSIAEVIISLISVEKVFRFYKPTNASVTDTVRVDKKIDEFLKSHFNLYSTYVKKSDKVDESYVYYTNLLEDEQLDDLTLVAIRRT